jgi:hypothetical protein
LFLKERRQWLLPFQRILWVSRYFLFNTEFMHMDSGYCQEIQDWCLNEVSRINIFDRFTS